MISLACSYLPLLSGLITIDPNCIVKFPNCILFKKYHRYIWDITLCHTDHDLTTPPHYLTYFIHSISLLAGVAELPGGCGRKTAAEGSGGFGGFEVLY